MIRANSGCWCKQECKPKDRLLLSHCRNKTLHRQTFGLRNRKVGLQKLRGNFTGRCTDDERQIPCGVLAIPSPHLAAISVAASGLLLSDIAKSLNC